MAFFQQHWDKLHADFPWVKYPLISNAPMGGFAKSEVAIAVTKAGGLGTIGFSSSVATVEADLEQIATGLKDTSFYNAGPDDVLPVGMGMILFTSKVHPWLATVEKYKPAMVFLSFGPTSEFEEYTSEIRRVSPKTKIWMQVGSVAAATEVVAKCKPDALVIQGADAGGHGHAKGASIVTLLPEVADALEESKLGEVPLIAAGGIMDARSTVAALALGAGGVLMGTRFLGCEEVKIDPEAQNEIFLAADGGESTVRSTVGDDIKANSPYIWPGTYDGRFLRNGMYEDWIGGMGIEEVRRRHAETISKEGDDKPRRKETSAVWVGTGVWKVKQKEPASAVVKSIQDGVREVLKVPSNSA